jgi:hypothetical protein
MRRRSILAGGILLGLVAAACGGSDSSTPPPPTNKPDGGSTSIPDPDGGGPIEPADWVIPVSTQAVADGVVTNALLGHYDLSGSLFRYDQVPNLAAQMKAIGFSEWRVGVGRWEVATQLLPTLTDATPCTFPGFPDESKAKPADELALIASRDWFIDDNTAVTLADTTNDARYKLDYLRSVIDVATKTFGVDAYVNIDHMPRAFAANKTPSRTNAYLPNACNFSWSNRVSNAGPADLYLNASPPGSPPIFPAAVVGLVKRIVEGSGGEPGRAVKYWELWNEPDLPYAWDRTLDDDKLTRFFTMALQVMVLLDAYRKESTNPNVKNLKFGLASFAIAKVAADVIASLDKSATPIPVDVFSFHSYSNDPLVIANDIKTVVSARAASSRFKNAELALTEWGPDLEKHPDPKSMTPALIIAEALILGANLGLDRAHHSIIWDFYNGVPFGVVDHAGNPKRTHQAYKLLSETIRTRSERLNVSTAPEGRLGGGAVLVVRDSETRAIRVLLVNRNAFATTARIDFDGAPQTPRAVSIFADTPSSWDGGRRILLPPSSIVSVTF